MIGIIHGKYPVHLYYGKKKRGLDPQYSHRLHSFSPYRIEEDGEYFSLDEAFLETRFSAPEIFAPPRSGCAIRTEIP